MPGVHDEARGAEQICRDQGDRSRAAGAGVAGLTLSEWVRDVLLGLSIETGTLAAPIRLFACIGDGFWQHRIAEQPVRGRVHELFARCFRRQQQRIQSAVVQRFALRGFDDGGDGGIDLFGGGDL